MKNYNNYIFALCIIFLGIGILLSVFLRRIKIDRLKKIGTRTDGIIFKNELEYTGDETGYYSPIIRFTTKNGEWITTKYKGIATYLSLYKPGEKVEILYEESNPKNCAICLDLKQRTVNTCFTIIGILLVILGSWFLLNMF